MPYYSLALVSLALLLGAPSFAQRHLSPNDVERLPSRSADARLPYGSDSLQFGDLRLPASQKPAPVAVVIHGGCWLASYATLRSTAALADALREQEGFVTWNIEYRRLERPGGGWPGTFLDVARAVDFVRELARRYPGRLDTTRVVVIGHSAGGHLACWTAMRHRLPAESAARLPGAPLRPSGVVNLDGPADLRPFVGADLQVCGQPVITQLLGAGPTEAPERWRAASPAETLPWGVPSRTIAGSTDGLLSPADCQAFIKKAQAAGDRDARFIPVPGAGHFEVIAPTAQPAWSLVRQAAREMADKKQPKESAPPSRDRE